MNTLEGFLNTNSAGVFDGVEVTFCGDFKLQNTVAGWTVVDKGEVAHNPVVQRILRAMMVKSGEIEDRGLHIWQKGESYMAAIVRKNKNDYNICKVGKLLRP